MPHAMSPQQALERLLEGNRRFVADQREVTQRAYRAELAAGQNPFAVVLGCSDSRTPAELVFDQGLGHLFVVRVAGNIVAPSQIGSAEFAVSQFGTPLVLVMGHTRCGAIAATVDSLTRPGDAISKHIQAITRRIAPHIEHLVRQTPHGGNEQLLREAMRANVRASVRMLGEDSPVLSSWVEAGRIRIVGAEYELETGRVLLLDERAL